LRLALPFAALGLLAATPASADVLFVCGSQGVVGDTLGAAAPPPILDPIRISATPRDAASGEQIALTLDEDGYDLVLHWGMSDEASLRDTGAMIVATGFGSELVHLVVSRDENAPLEHFIFAEEDGGFGSLSWAVADGEQNAAIEDLERQSLCVIPPAVR
jgi:hypothetical protein